MTREREADSGICSRGSTPPAIFLLHVFPSFHQVLSGTMVRIIEKIQVDNMTKGEPLDLELECYQALASRMNEFIDIFNGE